MLIKNAHSHNKKKTDRQSEYDSHDKTSRRINSTQTFRFDFTGFNGHVQCINDGTDKILFKKMVQHIWIEYDSRSLCECKRTQNWVIAMT